MRLGFVGMGVFSVIMSSVFIGLSVCVDSLFSFWVFLELAGLALIPSFFSTSLYVAGGAYSGLLLFVVMSAVSSVFFVSGILINGLYGFILLGFAVKLGVFPFMVWVYRVFSASNWLFIFLLSVVMKLPVLYFGYIFGGGWSAAVLADCSVTLLLCAGGFWSYSNCWEFIWCHMSLSSVSTLLAVCYTGDFIMCWWVYLYYSVWAAFCIFYFWSTGTGSFDGHEIWVLCFLLLVTPVSMPLFYKLGVCLVLFYSSVYLLLVWAVYSFSEQFFLFKLCGDNVTTGVLNGWFR
uniref:NADH dehydrogenase subunit 2 n=1 Tax=Parabreviscolex niepini TaxID=2041585 RepID=A0A3G2QWW4_9CEST|nr:NADH dehydrogenase subunit 2 [Parabreviscolex niepini]AYO27339.1 NADH dehydrogenase subunit 2 [Parabreviscolex niepini]